MVVAGLQVPGSVVDNPEDVLGEQFSGLRNLSQFDMKNSVETYMTVQELCLQGDPHQLLLLEVLDLLHADPHPGDVVVPAGAVGVPDSHHQAHLVQLFQGDLPLEVNGPI